MITPEQLANSGSEDGHQSALFCWAALPEVRLKYPLLRLMFAIPNGGSRDKREATKLKAMGIKSGVPDIMLPEARGDWHGLFIELKRPKMMVPNKLKKYKSSDAVDDEVPLMIEQKAGTTQNNQDKWIDDLTKQGYYVEVCKGWTWAVGTICHYLSL